METDQESPDSGLTHTIIAAQESSSREDWLVSRSKARQLLQRAEKFKKIVFDFRGIEWVAPAFADEIFRVFALRHPEIELVPINANLQVGKMIAKARHDLETFLGDN